MQLSKEYLEMKAKAEKATPTVKRDNTAIDFNPNPASKPMKTLKTVTIEAEFPELKGGTQLQIGKGSASNVKAAGAAAFRDLFKKPALKGKRVSAFKAIISIGTTSVEVSK